MRTLRNLIPILLIINGFIKPTFSETVFRDSSLTFMSHNRIFPVIFLDPGECQIHGGSYMLNMKDYDFSLYSLVNLGFYKPIISKTNDRYSWEINFGAATFTQFEFNVEDGYYLAGLLNNDYKLSGDFSFKRNKNIFRFRLFHLSSHLGDDYIIRNKITVPNDKSENYEQADLTYLRLSNENYWYFGFGEIYTKYVFRERFSIFGGGYYSIIERKKIDLFSSFNIRVSADHNFEPDVRFGTGINIKKENRSILKIWAEYYNGQLPYSTLDYGRVKWIGLAMWINI